MKQELLGLDFGTETSDTKNIKIKQSECTFENKTQRREELKEQINSLIGGDKDAGGVDYNKMAPNEIDKVLQKP